RPRARDQHARTLFSSSLPPPTAIDQYLCIASHRIAPHRIASTRLKIPYGRCHRHRHRHRPFLRPPRGSSMSIAPAGASPILGTNIPCRARLLSSSCSPPRHRFSSAVLSHARSLSRARAHHGAQAPEIGRRLGGSALTPRRRPSRRPDPHKAQKTLPTRHRRPARNQAIPERYQAAIAEAALYAPGP
ncbi:hypothetical protein TPAR_01354, partial [Tolypocladium paradoxum]